MNIQEMMKQAKKMQLKIEKAKNELKTKEFVITKPGIEVVIFGDRQLKSINIDEALLDDKSMVEALVQIAINEGNELIDQAQKLLEQSQQGAM